jgi:hypothetical protein
VSGGILEQAKAIQRRAALDQKCWVSLAFIEDMINEIERLEALQGAQDGREKDTARGTAAPPD